MLPVFSYFCFFRHWWCPRYRAKYIILENNLSQRSTLDCYRQVTFHFTFSWSFLFTRF